MSDTDQARTLLLMAEKDLKALEGMAGDPEQFADEVFGFHAQQAVEKAFKAWLASLGDEYPPVHNLGTLLGRLERLGVAISPFEDLAEYTLFGVAFRYGPMGDDLPLDRAITCARVRRIVEHVRGILAGAPAVP